MYRLVGRDARQFEMETALGDGSGFAKSSLGDYKGKWLVMFFYPLDFTFICPTEITAFSDQIDRFKEVDAEVLGVSTDSVHSHKAWINTPESEGGLGKLTFPLASDNLHRVSKDYGVYLEDEGVSLRGLFIIDPGGEIRYQLVHDNNVGRNVDEVLRVLKGLQNGGLCPINWHPGDDTL